MTLAGAVRISPVIPSTGVTLFCSTWLVSSAFEASLVACVILIVLALLPIYQTCQFDICHDVITHFFGRRCL